MIPTKECADDVRRRPHRHRPPAARRPGSSMRCSSSMPARRDGTAEIGRAAGARVIAAGRGARRVRAGARQGRRDVARAPRDQRRHRLLSRRGHGEPGSEPPSGADRAVARPTRRCSSSRARSTGRCAPEASTCPHEGGRVTELMARPLLNLHEPQARRLRPAARRGIRRAPASCWSRSRSRSATASRSPC